VFYRVGFFTLYCRLFNLAYFLQVLWDLYFFADFLKVLEIAEGKKVEKTTDKEGVKVGYEWGV